MKKLKESNVIDYAREKDAVDVDMLKKSKVVIVAHTKLPACLLAAV